METEALFFATPADFRSWFEKHHDECDELWVGFYKRGSSQPSITWPESVDQALCYGWIDGVRKSLDEKSYIIRFTPRKARSNWSSINIKRVQELKELGLMHPAGVKAFSLRVEAKSGIYSYEQRYSAALDKVQEQLFRANKTAWKYFQAQAPWYRRTAIYWVVSAKREETRMKRLNQLIERSEQGISIPSLTRPVKSG